MTTYYVSALNGSDSNVGTSSTQALLSLQAAANIVKPGDTVEVMNGTYTGPGYGDVVNVTRSGTAGAPIIFEAAPGQTPVIDSSGAWSAFRIGASYITVRGFTVVGDAAYYDLSYALANASTGNASLDGNGIIVVSPDGSYVPTHITIENNTVYNEPGGGIIANDADYVQILNNVVHDNAHWSVYGNSGISIGSAKNSDTLPGPHIVIQGNVSYNNTELVPEYRAGAITDGEGIILDTNPNYTGGFLVQGNTIYGNSGPGIESFLSDNATITGNTLGGNLTYAALASEGEIFIIQSKNNIVSNNTVTTTPPGGSTPPPGGGTASGGLVLYMAENAYKGDAQFTVKIDGTQVGSTYTATVENVQGKSQAFSIPTSLSAGTHSVAVTFINDANGRPASGTTATDRNLFVIGASYNGQAISGAAGALFSNGSDTFSLVVPQSGTTTTHTLVLDVSEDAYQGDAQFTVQVDGKQVGGVYTATASHNQGASQAINLGSFADGAIPHNVTVAFSNDAYGGTAATDRNLYVNDLKLDGKVVPGTWATLLTAGSVQVSLPSGTAGTHHLVLNASEDAYQGNALFTVQVDGTQVGGTYTATALHGQGQSQAVDLGFLSGTATSHDIAVTFLNDAYAGTSATDRNLYVDSIQLDGMVVAGTTAALMSSGADYFKVTVPTA